MLTLRNNFLPINTKVNLNNILDDFFTSHFLQDLPVFGWDLSRPYKSTFAIDETDSSYDMEIAIPGLSKKDILIETKDGDLTVSYEAKNGNQNSFMASSFKKIFKVPEDVNVNKIKATTDNGILKITFPKKESLKAKIIEVQ